MVDVSYCDSIVGPGIMVEEMRALGQKAWKLFPLLREVITPKESRFLLCQLSITKPDWLLWRI